LNSPSFLRQLTFDNKEVSKNDYVDFRTFRYKVKAQGVIINLSNEATIFSMKTSVVASPVSA